MITGGKDLLHYWEERGQDIIDGFRGGHEVAMIDTRHTNKLIFDTSYCITTRIDANNQYFIVVKDDEPEQRRS